MGPVPGVVQKFLAREVGLGDAFGGELGHHLGLGGDGGMVGAGHPEGVFPLHTGAAYEYVLNGIIEHVAHVEDARHVRGRYDDAVRVALIGLGVEEAVLHPVGIPFVFYFRGVVFGG